MQSIVLSNLNPEEIDQVLREDNPDTLHRLATEMLEKIKKITLYGEAPAQEAMVAFHSLLAQATFLQTRAVYLKLIADQKTQVETAERKLRYNVAQARFR